MKKTLCLVVSILLVCMFSTALAAVPSKTTGDLTDFIGAVDDSGASLADTGFAIKTGAAVANVESNTTTTQTAKKATIRTQADQLLKDIADYMKQKQASPIQYFGDEVLAKATTLVPTGTNLQAMTLNEFFPASIQGYNNTYGNVTASFTFATEYKPGQQVLAIVGVPAADHMVWYPMQAECGTDGVVAIHFTGELLQEAQLNEAVIAILSEAVV